MDRSMKVAFNSIPHLKESSMLNWVLGPEDDDQSPDTVNARHSGFLHLAFVWHHKSRFPGKEIDCRLADLPVA